MTQTGRILAVDDEEAILQIYREELEPLGWEVTTASSFEQAQAELDEGDWGLVLVDLKLRGAAAGDDGLALLDEIERRAPAAKAIVVTGYASPESIEQAFAAGAYDYLEKTPNFATLLRVKVENVMELQRQRWLTKVGDDADRAEARSLLSRLGKEPNAQRKGRLLEDLVQLLLHSVPGFVVTPRRRGLDEELDLVVRIDAASDGFWQREGQYILVECKNLSAPCDPKVLDDFRAKLKRRFGRAKLGFLVAPGGFTRGVRSRLATGRENDHLVVLVDGPDLHRLVEASDRSVALKELHQPRNRRALLRTMGRRDDTEHDDSSEVEGLLVGALEEHAKRIKSLEEMDDALVSVVEHLQAHDVAIAALERKAEFFAENDERLANLERRAVVVEGLPALERRVHELERLLGAGRRLLALVGGIGVVAGVGFGGALWGADARRLPDEQARTRHYAALAEAAESQQYRHDCECSAYDLRRAQDEAQTKERLCIEIADECNADDWRCRR